MKVSVGQKWRWTGADGQFFTKGREYVIRRGPDQDGLFIIDDNICEGDNASHRWSDDAEFRAQFELEHAAVRTVTRKEIIPGTYGLVEIESVNADGVSIWLPRNHRYTAAELGEMAATLDELADAAPTPEPAKPVV